MWALPSELRALHVIGMNRRNIGYIARYNDRSRFPLVDDKIKTKQLAQQHGVTSPELLGVIRTQFEVRQLANLVRDHQGFVIKPVRGSGGKGIVVIDGHDQQAFRKPSGAMLGIKDLERDVSNILSGLYSLAGSPDVAMIESLIRFDDRFADYTFEGVPDIRVIVFRGYPVMAMMRLSTAVSDGKANLHQGAVGVGLDISQGRALFAVQFNRSVDRHPDTGRSLDDLVVPGWPTLLNLAASAYEMTGLGYIGADLVIDKRFGPTLLELNARPGLAIQMANGEGLGARLELIEAQPEGRSIAERVDFSIKHFGRITNRTSGNG